MRTMFLDTSSQKLVICFVCDGKIEYLHLSDGKNNHSDNLLKYIEEGLNENNLEVSSFDRIVCGIGPGAYTGLRIALCVAKVFSWTKNIDLYTISSLTLLASFFLDKNELTSISLHAKNGYVYHKIISGHEVIEEDAFLSVEEARELDQKYQIKNIVTNENIEVDALNIKDCDLELVNDVFFLEPNYLREGM